MLIPCTTGIAILAPTLLQAPVSGDLAPPGNREPPFPVRSRRVTSSTPPISSAVPATAVGPLRAPGLRQRHAPPAGAPPTPSGRPHGALGPPSRSLITSRAFRGQREQPWARSSVATREQLHAVEASTRCAQPVSARARSTRSSDAALSRLPSGRLCENETTSCTASRPSTRQPCARSVISSSAPQEDRFSVGPPGP